MIDGGVGPLVRALVVSAALVTTLAAGAQPSPTNREALVATWKPQFTAAYDAANDCEHARQTRDEYLKSVHEFYFGNILLKGWFARVDELLNKFDEPVRAGLETRLNALGKKVAAEWAKHNSCRKIRTDPAYNKDEGGKPSLSEWGDQLRASVKRDTGDGKALGNAIDDVNKQADAALK